MPEAGIEPTGRTFRAGENDIEKDQPDLVSGAPASGKGGRTVIAAPSALYEQSRCRKAYEKEAPALISHGESHGDNWSSTKDSNLRPLAPKASALPNCASAGYRFK